MEQNPKMCTTKTLKKINLQLKMLELKYKSLLRKKHILEENTSDLDIEIFLVKQKYNDKIQERKVIEENLNYYPSKVLK